MAGAFTITFIDSAAVKAGLARFEWTARAVAWADRVGPRLAQQLRTEAPVGKGPGAGRLRDSITYQRRTSVGSVKLEYHSDVPYVWYVIDGTAPHEIRPVAALALHWSDAGGEHFAKRVMHPGTRPNRFHERALKKQLPVIAETFFAAFRKI